MMKNRYVYREIAAIEGVNDEGLVAEVDNPGDPVASLECSHRPGDELAARKILHCSVIITVFNVL